MFTFILYVILAVIFGYFATQNTESVTISLLGATLRNIPLYLILGATLIVGLTFSWLINLIDSISVAMKIRSKEHDIKDSKATISRLQKEINDLKIRNAQLAGELKSKPVSS